MLGRKYIFPAGWRRVFLGETFPPHCHVSALCPTGEFENWIKISFIERRPYKLPKWERLCGKTGRWETTGQFHHGRWQCFTASVLRGLVLRYVRVEFAAIVCFLRKTEEDVVQDLEGMDYTGFHLRESTSIVAPYILQWRQIYCREISGQNSELNLIRVAICGDLPILGSVWNDP